MLISPIPSDMALLLCTELLTTENSVHECHSPHPVKLPLLSRVAESAVGAGRKGGRHSQQITPYKASHEKEGPEGGAWWAGAAREQAWAVAPVRVHSAMPGDRLLGLGFGGPAPVVSGVYP